ncbi:TauD/TfdA dioxygenase family protein [Sphingopyxis panaciterrulae]|uniref:Taurine dioxygenase n=1 Tax=Sphingopyxis panaciterrulae TaxID=462372 RepID=A0A7W9ER67_9SPHN|nr:TauD/TfdA family dioxygenase [Sphingopyxis panaciterrulae]MBB5707427.1 taurine dioxygenase [Sphingopyxis panaciterrulae]
MSSAIFEQKDMATGMLVSPIGGHIGAEITGIDLSGPLTDTVCRELRAALSRHGVLFIPGQDLTLAQYVRLGEAFGELEVNDTLAHPAGYPQVGSLVKEAGHVTSIGDMWHTDHTYLEKPLAFTMLRALEIPPHGGDTLFLSAKAAFAALPDSVKDTLRSLRALHSRSYLIRDGKYAAQFLLERPPQGGKPALNKTAVHPVVTTIPETGEEVLFVNPGYVVKFEGWSAKLSQGLLASLFEHCHQPEFQCRLRWQEKAIAIWDNRQTWHFAVNDYHGHRRSMQRLVIGERSKVG